MESGSGGRAPTLADVVHRYGRWMASTLRARFPKEAEDLEQEALLRLGRNLPKLRDPREEAVRALISMVLRSVMVDEIRRRQDPRCSALPIIDDVEDRAPIEPVADLREEVQRVRSVFDILSEEQRTVLRMHFDDGLGLREIADILGVPRGTVAAWYSRGLNLLRERLR